MLENGFVELMLRGIAETLYMTLASTAASYVIGLPMGVVLCVTGENGICPNRPLNAVLGTIVNIIRSVPFIILLVAVIPVTRFIVGTSLGSSATIVPLVIGAAPFVARLVETSLSEVSSGVIEAGRSMGASTWQLITKVLVPEAAPSLIANATTAATTILGYSAMAGFVGGGGLGAIAINYGYYRYETVTMLVTVALMVVIVQLIQSIGTATVKRSDKRKK
ncbi:MAG: methionine ABC transporter permease [Eubacteriales bacterium]|nr:methionine ABC transporter permease [Eubacteriales bacterium]